MASKAKGNKHHGTGRNNGPSRAKYANTNALKEHKIRRMMRCNRVTDTHYDALVGKTVKVTRLMTRAEAEIAWDDARRGRRMRKPGSASRSLGSVVANFRNPTA
jgi:hypothetical protein